MWRSTRPMTKYGYSVLPTSKDQTESPSRATRKKSSGVTGNATNATSGKTSRCRSLSFQNQYVGRTPNAWGRLLSELRAGRSWSRDMVRVAALRASR